VNTALDLWVLLVGQAYRVLDLAGDYSRTSSAEMCVRAEIYSCLLDTRHVS
jgi:hypothetical protein